MLEQDKLMNPQTLNYREYSEALDHIEQLFNRLCIKKKLGENCNECVFLTEIDKLRLLAQDKIHGEIESELGYHMP